MAIDATKVDELFEYADITKGYEQNYSKDDNFDIEI